MDNKYAVLSLSGGMDSSTLLLRLLSEGYQVTAISFDYGQKHFIELSKAKELIQYLGNNGYDVNYKQISIEGLSELLTSSLITSGQDIPTGHYKEETMKLTVVPNRNKIFSSIIQSIALSQSNKHNLQVKIALGIHAGDHAIYPDCRQEFRDIDYQAFISGNWDAERVTYYTPYLNYDKSNILQDGLNCCQLLNLNFNEIYQRTLTSYSPLYINGQWYSDYKSSSSIERIEAFLKLNLIDPAQYADENGWVCWDIVKNHVEDILRSHT